MGKVIVLGANKGYSKKETIKVEGALNICINVVQIQKHGGDFTF